MTYKALRAGDLNRRITIQQNDADGSVRDEVGGIIPEWTDFETVWASVVPVSGREVWQSDRLQGQVTHKVTIRYSSDIVVLNNANYRILYAERVFEILAVIDTDERHERLVIYCREDVGHD